ncbi:MAG: ECF transporter S component [Ruminococcaceae bacterium]|nr:ECF transporter S component [Oscillospiraceae bacterium]
MRANQQQRILNMAILAMLLALVIVLQIFAGFIKVGPFSPSFVLIPIVVAAILTGPKGGAFIGAAFGVVVIIQCFSGIDAGGFILWGINPFLTALICLVKGIAAGVVPGVVYKAIAGKEPKDGRILVAAVLASLTAPVVNTGLFIIGLSTFFTETLYAWSGGTNVMLYILTGLIGINFIIEFSINAVVSPAISTVTKIATKKLIKKN